MPDGFREYRTALNDLRSAQTGLSVEEFRSKLKQETINARSLADMAAAETKLDGEVRINGSGESTVPITFPVLFTEKPHLSFGAELIEGDALTVGFMPTISVVILGWITQESPPSSRFYRGAKLGVVTTGVRHQKMVVHWHLNGVAMANPV